MGKIDKLKSGRRFGSRYGGSMKHKFAKIEQVQRQKHKCPYCHYTQVKRISTGIWNCRKCGALFTGKAYTLSDQKVKTLSQSTPQQVQVAPTETVHEEPVMEEAMHEEPVAEAKQ